MTPAPAPGSQDPRQPVSGVEDIRPVVAPRRGRTPAWIFGAAIVLGGVALFAVLDQHRRTLTAPTTRASTSDAMQMASALPPLYIASELPPPPPPPPPPSSLPVASPIGSAAPLPRQMPPSMPFVPPPMPPNYVPPGGFPPPQAMPPQAMPPSMPYQPPSGAASNSAVLVIDNTAGAATTGTGQAGAEAGVAESPVRASRLGRRGATVPQGTLIPAVLETALDSTRPGHVRAIVSRDITGFDGSQVLIPRGTRLFGEYAADLVAGQNRAFVQWTRLVRPDGVTIALASPAADIEGRAGIPGKVNSHFLARFGNAFLQSTLNFGMGLAGRSLAGDSSLVVALPGAIQGGTGTTTSPAQVQPTLRVNAGVRVTVFVARDLEFPAVEARR
jgi:type IV secretion system protein VirB10